MFLDDFDKEYASLLNKRESSFRKIFEYLIDQKKNEYLILETGTSRYSDKNQLFSGDGGSTFLYNKFISEYGGLFISIDIDRDKHDLCLPNMGPNTKLITNDSVKELYKISQSDMGSIDLLYLDSFDLDWSYSHPSAFHHIKELISILPKIKSGTLIVVDDNQIGGNITGVRPGKGEYIYELMLDLEKEILFDEYQIGWIW